MDEKLLQHIWKHKLFAAAEIKTVSGEVILIKSAGNENFDSGPDFVDARIKINDALWAGCVEVHLKSSDWEKHNHQKDNAYSNVILHVVYEHDRDNYTDEGYLVPVLELKSLVNPQLINTYKTYMSSLQDIVCQNQLCKLDTLRLFSWLDRLLIERLEERTLQIEELLEETTYSKEDAFYYYLANSFGFNTNALPFSLLAKSLPLICLAKQKDSLLQIEAMLFGQADLLPKEYIDDYSESLKAEYHFLQRKFSLQPLCKASMWKFAKIYPSGFPTIRIAQFAALIHQSSSLLSKVLAAKNIDELVNLFTVTTSDYWKLHYKFGKPSSGAADKALGKSAVYSLLINTVLPFIYAYSKWNNDTELQSKVIKLYESMPVEDNKTTRKYTAFRPDFTNALHSQSLIQLYNNYCNGKKCLQCGIGLYLINN